jgi:DNA-binding PadR family transcriptional regulator
MLLFPEKESKISSLVEYLILLTLRKEGRLRGVDIINKISEQFKNWEPQSGTIYPVLNRLFKKRYVIQEGKYYQITELGEGVLKEYLQNFIDTIIFIDSIFNYGRDLMDGINTLRSEEVILQNHLPHVKTLIDALPMVRSQPAEESSSEFYGLLSKIRDILQDTLQALDTQIIAIKDEEKIVRVKIK